MFVVDWDVCQAAAVAAAVVVVIGGGGWRGHRGGNQMSWDSPEEAGGMDASSSFLWQYNLSGALLATTCTLYMTCSAMCSGGECTEINH